MKIIICPGIHARELTDSFLAGLRLQSSEEFDSVSVFPAEEAPAYSPRHVLEFLLKHHRSAEAAVSETALLFIAFSAGVVGAIGAARLWRRRGGTVKALIALDGWGVPLEGDFAIHRISHDSLTHWSSTILGRGSDGFFADPPVDHLTLWRSPETVQGWRLTAADHLRQTETTAQPYTVANFITALLHQYERDI